jgi:hypothetical protein
MNQLEKDILYLYDIESRLTHMSDQFIGICEVTELDVMTRKAVHNSGLQVRLLMRSLNYLQEMLNREERI